MNIHQVLWIAATVSFFLGAANIPGGVNWLCLGLGFASLTMLV